MQNLADLFQANFHLYYDDSSKHVSVEYQQRYFQLPIPDLESWAIEDPRVTEWRGIKLLQSCNIAENPDLLGLAWYLFEDIEELKQESRFPNQRYNTDLAPISHLIKFPFLDELISEIKKGLDLSQSTPPCGLILTHDLDILSLEPTFYLTRLKYALLRGDLAAIISNSRALIHKVISHKATQERFEFLDWCALEENRNMRSLFFVFSDDRNRNDFRDGWYDSNFLNRDDKKATLGTAFKYLVENGFELGLHLSLSSQYKNDEFEREYSSLSNLIGHPIKHTRNHWYWMRYSDWYDRLRKLEIRYDFNVRALGYAKGTSYPYTTRNNFTRSFPCIFMDDVVLKPQNNFASSDEALGLLEAQLINLKRFGGCPTISFHPAEDGPPEMYKVGKKLDFYQDVLTLIDSYKIPVFSASQAEDKFFIYTCK